MFKKWKEKDIEKEKKEKKYASKPRGDKEKKSFGDVLAGYENISSPSPKEKEKGVFGFGGRKTQSERRKRDEEASSAARRNVYKQRISVDSESRDIPAGVNGRTGLNGGGEVRGPAGKNDADHEHDRRASQRKSSFTVDVKSSSVNRNGRDNPAADRKERIKAASGSEVTVNIGLGSEIMAGLGNGTREFLVKRASSDKKTTMDNDNKVQGVNLYLPELQTVGFENGRILKLKRRPIGDFGFVLRRSTLSGDNTKTIHLAEPLAEEHNTGLMPGDRLVEVNGLNVENSTRDQIINSIAASGDEVSIKVVPVPELAELSSRTTEVELSQSNNNKVSPTSKGFSLARSGSMRSKRSKAKSDADIASEKAWLDAEKVWLIHAEGFSAGRLLKRKNDSANNLEDSKCLVKLDHGGEVIEVEEEQVAKANPPQFDHAEDLTWLRHLNESACLHTLRQRFGSNLIHTYGGPNLMVINPREQLSIYTDKVIEMFRGCKQEDMPPHIYSMAQTSYRNMQAMRTDQSIILLGRSGSGKTTNLKHLVRFYTTATLSTNSNVSAQKMEAAFCLLESFGTAKTYLCDSASRFSLLLTLEYDMADLLTGVNLQTYLLEKTRVIKRQLGESSFKIFYDLILGCDEKLRKELYLNDTLQEDNSFINILATDIDRTKCSDRWVELQFALEALDLSSDEARGLWAPIAAIFHLGAAGISPGTSTSPAGFANQRAAQRAANALGTTENELARIIFSSGSSPSKPRPSPDKTQDPTQNATQSDVSQASVDIYHDSLEGFVMGLYVETFSALLRLINRCISTSARVNSMLQILDSPGFQDPISVHPKSNGGTFEDLCYNYACEKLHWFLHFATFTSQLERYNRENIDCNFELEDSVPPNATLAALDRLNSDHRRPYAEKNDPRGIFWILEDEAMRSSTDNVGLVEKIIMQHGHAKDGSMVRPGQYSDTFKLSHLQKTVDVTYCTDGWLKRVKEHPAIKMAYNLLTESKKHHVADLYVGHRSGVLQVEIARTRSVKKRSSHGPTIPAIKKNSACMLLKMQMDTVLETLRRTNCRFVHCFLSDADAGTPSSLPRSPGAQKTPPKTMLNVPLLRKQFRSSRVLQGIRMHRQGYPEFMAFGEFRRRFANLLPRNEIQNEPVLDEKQVVEKMVEQLELDKRSYRIGLSQIFFRSGSLPQLEDARDEKLNGTIIGFQALCRGYIGRKNVKKLKVQVIAITCLQRNVRKYMSVKNWEWWKLYTKVAPLLDVHRTEEELKSKTGELGLVKSKLEKMENENKELVAMNAKLKKRINDLTATISEVQTSAASANELLEHESAERSRLEEEIERLKEKHEALVKEHDHVHTELLEAKVAQPVMSQPLTAVNDDKETSGEVDKINYNLVGEDIKNLRQKLLHEVEDEIETLTMQKRHAEKQLAEEQEETDDLRKQLANVKRKYAKFNEEMEDMKLILETSHIRNGELEKKQRKFDQEINAVKDELQQEKSHRELAQKERDTLSTSRFSLENELKEKDEELDRLQNELKKLQHEINDFAGVGKTGDSDVLTLKRDKRDLELKVQDQEEELDEQAGQIQMLEQAKLRLEMASQRDKQQFQKDIDNKDDEIEEMRSDHQKKMRQMEEQVEEEYREKNEAVKMRRELERKVFELQNTHELADRGSEKKLRKELKKLRILYKDAKYALESQSLQNTDKAQLKQLRNQLEDIEFAKHIVVKSKKQLESDIDELQKQLEEMARVKQEVDDRNIFLARENADILSKMEDGEDDMEEILRKNKQLITQISTLEVDVVDKNAAIDDLASQKDILESKVQQLTTKLAYYEETTVDRATVQRQEAKIRELEAKLDLDSTLKSRLEQQVQRLKNNIASLQDERDNQTNRESRMKAEMSKCQRQAFEMKEEIENLQKREDEQKRRREAAESEVENLDETLSLMKTEQNVSTKRIRDLQEALEREMMASSSDDEDFSDFDSDTASVSSRLSASGKRSLDRRAGHYDRSTRLRRRLTALEDESSGRLSPRKTSTLDSGDYGSSSRKSSHSSYLGRTSSIDGYGMPSNRYFGDS
eukprot:gene13873-15321_t